MAQDKDGIMCTDLTGKFPVTSIEGHKHILVLCHYDDNAMLIRPLKSRSDNDTLKTWNGMCECLTRIGFPIVWNGIDNEASRALKTDKKASNIS